MKVKMTECLRGEMLGTLTKIKYPKLSLDWILKTSNDESNQVHISFFSCFFCTIITIIIITKELTEFRRSLLPWLIATCAQTDDIVTLNDIQQAETGIKFNVSLPSGTMPLHICAKHDSVRCADLLLRIAENEDPIVNEPDQIGFTPLYYAVLQKNETMIDLLVRHGAKLTSTLKPSEIGMYLCNCVKNNQVDQLQAWHKAGADLDQTDYDGRTPLLLVILT